VFESGSYPVEHTRFARLRARLEAFEPCPGWRAWYLLMYISFVIVAAVHRPRERALPRQPTLKQA
jgi:hypothetical protein